MAINPGVFQIKTVNVVITKTKSHVKVVSFCCTPMADIWPTLRYKFTETPIKVCPFCGTVAVVLPDENRTIDKGK